MPSCAHLWPELTPQPLPLPLPRPLPLVHGLNLTPELHTNTLLHHATMGADNRTLYVNYEGAGSLELPKVGQTWFKLFVSGSHFRRTCDCVSHKHGSWC